jgi:hypothetical protein
MKYILLFLFLTSCESYTLQQQEPDVRFNHEEEQDKDCLNSTGGMKGYCDRVYMRQVK